MLPENCDSSSLRGKGEFFKHLLNPKSEFAGHVSISLFSTLIGELHDNACLFDLVSRVTLVKHAMLRY